MKVVCNLIKVTVKGNFNKTMKFLNRMEDFDVTQILSRYGKIGVSALAAATPKDDGSTAASWNYEITNENGCATIYWTNNDQNKGVYIAVILYYGHGTGTGGYVAGRDYIKPAIRPVFDQIAEAAWKEVTKR